MINIWLISLLFAVLLSGGSTSDLHAGKEPVSETKSSPMTVTDPSDSLSAAKPSEAAATDQEPLRSQEELSTILEHFRSNQDDFEKAHGVKVMLSGVGKDHIMITLRRYGEVDKPFSDEEKMKLKEALYELAGGEFPLKLGFNDCCKEEAAMEGSITKIDKEHQRVLIVNPRKKNGKTNDPEATWFGMTKDGKIVLAGEQVGFDRLAVGQQVRAWSNGYIDQSYPGQTSALKIEVVKDVP